MPGLGFAPNTGRMAGKSTASPSTPASSSTPSSSSSSPSSPFAVCYVSPKPFQNTANSNNRPSPNSNNHNRTIVTVNSSNNNSLNNNNYNNGVDKTNNNEKQKVDPSDPRVKKLVYSMYRDMLTSRNGEANTIISKKDPAIVTQDSGVTPILETIIMRQRGSIGGGGDSPGGVAESSTDCATEGEKTNGTSTMAPPPPPPPMMPGALPAVRLTSEIGPRGDRGMPAALAGAMMKDKKPFTYTPGGIDLSEIRSPRMAKRIQMNAAAEGVTNTPTPSGSSASGNQERAPCQLPPAALAAMQPQMAIPVFPQGNMNTVQLNRSHKPADYAGQATPPPPPPPQPMSAPIIRQPPPPPPSTSVAPLSPQPTMTLQQPVSPAPKSPSPLRTPPTPPERAATPKSPIPPTETYFGGSPVSNLEGRRSPLGRKSPAVETAQGIGTGSLFIPPIQNTPQNQMQSPPPPPPAAPKSPSPMSTYVPPSARPAGQTKAQAVSQNIGSLYIPPIGAQAQHPSSTGTASGGAASNGSSGPANRTPPSAQATPMSAGVPATPQLNKAPVPWMNSYNRIQNQQADSPPYVHPGFFMPPWGPQMGSRTIPIMMGGDAMDSGVSPPYHQGAGTESRRSSSGSSTPSGSRTPSQAATHLGRVIPIQIEREEAAKAKGAKVIPIQIEGRPPRVQTPVTPSTPGMNPMRRGPPLFNSPLGLYSAQNAMDAYQRQAAEAAAAGVDKMNIRCESPRTEPMQSKSLRVIQQAAKNVHEGSTEPRFMGGHIPSRAFRALQTALPASPGAQDLPPPSFPAAAASTQSAPSASGGPVTHHIPIRQVVSPTPPQSQPTEFQMSSQQGNVPPSEQKVQEPKKYMGSNIPSRSFKILQQMTADDGGQPAVDSAVDDETALEQNTAESYSDDVDDEVYNSPATGESLHPHPPIFSPCNSSSISSFPLSLSCSSEGGGSATFDPYHNDNCNNNNDTVDNTSCNGNNISDSNKNDNDGSNDGSSCSWLDNQQGWDAYSSYMWYYWWYYASCYWAGYDMTGYEYPPGWDPNYPYCPPEFYDYDYCNAAAAGAPPLGNEYCSAGSGTDLENSFGGGGDYSGSEQLRNQDNNVNDDNARMIFGNSATATGVPRIVIEDEDRKKSNVGVDSIKDNDSSLRSSRSSSSNNNSKVANPSSTSSKCLTECNEKPGSLPTKIVPSFNSKTKNDCDKDMNVCGGEKMNAWMGNHNRKNSRDNEENVDEVNEKNEQASSSDDEEYESCCEDPEQKVIERETGPCNTKNNRASFPSSQSFPLKLNDNGSGGGVGERKFELNNGNNYNSELNANDYGSGDSAGVKGNSREKNYPENEDDEDEKTDPGTDEDNDDDYGERVEAIIEEPETPSSADDSDATTIANGELLRYGKSPSSTTSHFENNGVSIEEYHSESSESAIFDYGLGKNRLSTIDEITESRASSSLLSTTSLNSSTSCNTVTAKNIPTAGGAEDDADVDYGKLSRKKNENGKNSNSMADNKKNGGYLEEDSEESSDELSSVSVIENKSDATRGTESKREDETTSTSDEEDSSTDDDDDHINSHGNKGKIGESGQHQYEDDDNDDEDVEEGADTAVTVRLPLKLCFTKTKSYRDIATLMVGDSEIEESSQVSMPSSSSNDDEDKEKPKKLEKVNGNVNDDEPVVSFTLSLSRQTSREDEPEPAKHKEKPVINSKDCNESDDIDFWAEITKGEDEENNFRRGSVLYCEKENEIASMEQVQPGKEGNNENEGDENEQKEDYKVAESERDKGEKMENDDSKTDGDFWGAITRDRSASDCVRLRKKDRKQKQNEGESCYGWDPHESIDYKWEKDFNFWEKSSRTIETRRFSGNFEITEDYESDSGIKPSTERKERVKKYTHHKRHSIAGPMMWDNRSSLPPRPSPRQQQQQQFTIPLIYSNKERSGSPFPGFNNNEQEIKQGEERKFDEASNSSHSRRKHGGKLVGMEGKSSVSLSIRQTTDCYQDDTDTSSWWSYWDEVSKQSEEEKLEINEDDAFTGGAGTTATTTTLSSPAVGATAAAAATEKEMENCSAFTSCADDDISQAIKLSDAGGGIRTSLGESTGGEEDYQSCASSIGTMQASRMEPPHHHHEENPRILSLESKNCSEKEGKSLLNTSCQSDATDNEDYSSSSPEIKSTSLLFPSSSGNQEEAVTSTTAAVEKLIQQSSILTVVSDENSDESSRSSGTTIGRHDKTSSEIKQSYQHQQMLPQAAPAPTSSDIKADGESHLKNSKDGESTANTSSLALPSCSSINENEEETASVHIPVTVERNVEIQHELGDSDERMKLNMGRQQQYQEDAHHHHHLHSLHHQHHHHHNNSSINTASPTSTTTCTCLMGDRIARAENLLWRIERFLHESLSLGSEDDSGVMTDLSRQISDVDTDVDNDMNDTEFLLTAATAAAKERRGVSFRSPPVTTPEPTNHHPHIESCNFAETISSTDPPPQPSTNYHHQNINSASNNSSSLSSPSNNNNKASSAPTTISSQVHTPPQHQVKRPRPKSDIFLDSTTLSNVELEELEASAAAVQSSSATVEENNLSGGVKMRSASERRALRYQRAKTHSRLFQLLQDECGKDEEPEEFDYESDVGTLTSSCNHNNKSATVTTTSSICQISVDTGASSRGLHNQRYSTPPPPHHQHQQEDDGSYNNNNSQSNNENCTGTSPTRMNDAQIRARSRLLPLPIKNLLASSLSLDSNSSPSGSSGVLSPTSPVNRDQLLADIINEFHLRNQATTIRAQSQRRLSNSFPSKIFKLLQHEFGEEFYQTFDCCGGSGGSGGGMEDCVISPSVSTNLCVNDSSNNLAGGSSSSSIVHECTIHKSESMKEFEEATNRILTNFMLRNTINSSSTGSNMKPKNASESTTLTASSNLAFPDDSRNDFLEVPLRRKKSNGLGTSGSSDM